MGFYICYPDLYEKCCLYLQCVISIIPHLDVSSTLGMGAAGMQPGMLGGLQPPNLFAAMQQRPNLMNNMPSNDTFQMNQQQQQQQQPNTQNSQQQPQQAPQQVQPTQQQQQQNSTQPPQSLPQQHQQQTPQLQQQPNGESANVRTPAQTPGQTPNYNTENPQQPLNVNNQQSNDSSGQTPSQAQPTPQNAQANRTVAFTPEMIQVSCIFV